MELPKELQAIIDYDRVTRALIQALVETGVPPIEAVKRVVNP